jgi:hypothetical protein
MIDKKKKFKLINTDVLDFENCLKDFFNRKDSIKISKVFRIDYYPNGDIIFSNTYELGFQKIF